MRTVILTEFDGETVRAAVQEMLDEIREGHETEAGFDPEAFDQARRQAVKLGQHFDDILASDQLVLDETLPTDSFVLDAIMSALIGVASYTNSSLKLRKQG